MALLDSDYAVMAGRAGAVRIGGVADKRLAVHSYCYRLCRSTVVSYLVVGKFVVTCACADDDTRALASGLSEYSLYHLPCALSEIFHG